ncbi:MAG TPA: hypothetical protein VK970_04050 [Candidatus Methylacidiphilales bacterium]|nr:hypothetical protein [Candidatus Methylacidiphilales bacterium]
MKEGFEKGKAHEEREPYSYVLACVVFGYFLLQDKKYEVLTKADVFIAITVVMLVFFVLSKRGKIGFLGILIFWLPIPFGNLYPPAPVITVLMMILFSALSAGWIIISKFLQKEMHKDNGESNIR